MRIGALKKSSLLDYPGKVSAVVGAQGCNMHCPWCHNFHLIPYEYTRQSQIWVKEDLLGFLDRRKDFLEGVVITGGEPTIQSGLPAFCEHLKDMGFAVKLDTNGTHPRVLGHLLENDLVDYIAMDLKTDLGQYHQLFNEDIDVNQILESIDLIMSSDRPYEFRTTCIAPFVTTANIDQMGRLIKGAGSLFLQKCNPTEHTVNGSGYEIADASRLVELQQHAAAYVLNCAIR